MLIHINIKVPQAAATCVMIDWDQTNGLTTHKILTLILYSRETHISYNKIHL